MIIFKKARSPKQTLNDLDSYLQSVGTEPIKLLARSVQSWGEISYDELADLIADGRLDDYLDWQGRYSALIAGTLAPLWSDAITAASRKATAGKVVLYDSNDYVRAWLETHGGELITQLSRESQKAVAMVILLGQSNRMASRDIAKQVRPLIGLNERQAAANLNYREKVYNKYREQGMGEVKARERADKAAIKYAGKQHRFRAETIVHTELAFAYNRGAHMGVSQGIADGLMGRCAMKWSTAGTNRVCSRCLALKDTIVGYTDESGVTLPPLHPRCRCAIIYDEVAAPRRIDNKPKSPLGDRNYNSEFAKTIGKEHYDKIRDIVENTKNVKAAQVWAKYENQIKVKPLEPGHASAYQRGDSVYLNIDEVALGNSIKLPYQTAFHEVGHLVDYLVNKKYLSSVYKDGAFSKAIKADLDSLLEARAKDYVLPKRPMARIRNLLKNKEWFKLREENLITQEEFLGLAKVNTRAETKKQILENLSWRTDDEIREIIRGRLLAVEAKKFCTEMEANYSLLDRSSLSDTFEGYAYSHYALEFRFGSGHGKEYWQRANGRERISLETFAHFVESAIANPGSLEVLNKFLPTASKVFDEMLDEILK